MKGERQCPLHQLEVQIVASTAIVRAGCGCNGVARSPTRALGLCVPALLSTAGGPSAELCAAHSVLREPGAVPHCWPEGAPGSTPIFLRALPRARRVKSEQGFQSWPPTLPHNISWGNRSFKEKQATKAVGHIFESADVQVLGSLLAHFLKGQTACISKPQSLTWHSLSKKPTPSKTFLKRLIVIFICINMSF